MKLQGENFIVLNAVDQNIYCNVPLTVIQTFLKSEDFITKRSSSLLPDIHWSIVLHSFVSCITVTFTHFFCWTLSFSYLFKSSLYVKNTTLSEFFTNIPSMT